MRPFLRPGFFALLVLSAIPPGAWGQTSQAWQQHVAYEMDVTLLADRHEMRGYQRLVYTNNSPDTLYTAYYHLYFNAFRPHSVMAERNRHLPDPDSRVVPRIFDLGPEEIGYHRILSLHQDDEPVSFEITDTILEVDLAHPILPGTSTVFEMRFYSRVPLQTRRSGRDNREGIDFSMTQWYPKIAAYDLRGWHPDPYVGREFYAPYGSFDVEITLPAAYTIGATGVLQNPEEIGHGYGQSGHVLYRPGERTYASADSLTWHFEAENVHDFAWAADPAYLHERFEDDAGRVYHLLYQGDVEERWEPMDRWVPALIQFYSREIGPYAYPQFTVVQGGDGGMEYPMLNLITGERPPRSLLGVTAHEAAHEWFYAALGSNESDYAWMDEGFTSYASREAMAYVLGRGEGTHTGAYLSVLTLQHYGLFERLSTPADWFTTNAAYSTASYPGGEMLVDMLGYVIGEDVRDAWLEEYYRRFTFHPPTPYDLERLAEHVSGLRLDWYFEQFTNTTRRHDYALADLDVERATDGWQATVTLERRDEIVLPTDVKLTLAGGAVKWVNVPLGIMYGHKPVPESWIVAEPWGWTSPQYTFTVEDLPARPVRAELDPRGMTPDYNRLNNTAAFPVEARFLRPPGQDWFAYRVGWRPLAQYANNFGFGVGLQARGQYLFGNHRLKATLKVWPQVVLSGGDEPELDGSGDRTVPDNADGPATLDASWFSGIDYALTYAKSMRAFGPLATLEIFTEKHLGFLENTITFTKPLAPILAGYDARFTASLIHQLNPTDRVFGRFGDSYSYRICPTVPPCYDVSATRYTNPFLEEHMLSGRLGYTVESENGDRISLMVEAGSSLKELELAPDRPFRQSATRFLFEATKTLPLGPLTARADVAFGLGAKNLALHKQFRLGAASFEGRWRDAAFRTMSAPFEMPLADAHLAAFSNAGPVAYLLAAANEDEINVVGGTPIGRNLLAGRLALTTEPLSENDWLAPLRLEVFSGIGDVWSDGAFLSGFEATNLLADAGVGVRYDVSEVDALSRWTAQSDVLQGLDVVAQFPVWASAPERIDEGQDPFAFRWLLGISVGD